MSDDAKAMSEWVTAVARELGLEGALDSDASVDLVLDMTSDVAHGVSRPAAPVTAFLIGVAAGRADDPAVAARDYAGKVSKLAEGWDADTERGVPANDQDARG
ncbi:MULTISPECIES: DUF6457 domain-containing protein [unclassified Pseudonocardia]|uniref:DUF6457 domain-containing protein n=1 Tax=unclassified Pseudonocardia TaxID=2619320 RepID=UPI0026259C31|nr:DUF6457 domain-containing protein [Pseudonocardia sp.]MCU1626347.1 Molybdopterin-guanine dinucleotide biosynthesis protein A-like protein [Pseudonocardia sp.]MDT7703701.1 hypothetical protein [Pseudonocardiales bacterium]HEV7469032.1 DUF6457 domain-containing protein [Pseudonocardia sp.]